MEKYVLAIDQGTTGTTVLLLDRSGACVGRAYSEFRQIYPKPGWVEHDPEEIWEVTRQVVRQALTHSGITAREIAAIGITNQRETTVLWERRSGKPVHNAIVWQCRRTAPICDDLRRQGKESWFRERTGLMLDAYFSGTKVQWLLENVKGARAQAEQGDLLFGTIDSWLVWKLSGGRTHVTDYTNASRTLLFNIHERRWDPSILSLTGIPASVLPEVKPSSGVCAHTAPEPPFEREIPIAGIAGDQQAALFGQGCHELGMVKNTYGTGCFLVMYTGDRPVVSSRGLLTTLACAADGEPAYALEGSIFTTGAAIQWLRDGLKILTQAAESEELARSVEDAAGVYVVPAFVGLGAPHWDMGARGAILGLTRGVGRAHIARATLEAIAYQSRDVIEVMKQEAGIPIRELRVDGGASANDFLMQFQADILDVRVDRPAMIDTTALGAAFLAGMATGIWKSPSELERARRPGKTFQPSMASTEREKLYRGWLEAVARVRTKV
ncbi:MAG: glycerol kinase GlpK [bacterium]